MALDKNNNKSEGPLSDILVIDASQGIAGPYCGATLASYGARVIKIDPPQGDWGRAVGKSHGTLSAYSIVYNRGKESVVLDLKNSADLQLLYALVTEADIFIESSRPGIAKKLAIDFERLTEKNQSLIYLSVSGFGQKGPYAARPCTDGVAQAFSGLVDGNVGLDGACHKFDLPIVDITTGLYAFQSVSMALLERQRTGKAQYLDVNLVTSALEIQKAKLFEQHIEGRVAAKLNVPSGIYQCKDGGSIAFALANEKHYQRLLDAIGAEGFREDSRFEGFSARAENAELIRTKIQSIFELFPAVHWLGALSKAGIIVNKINILQDVLADENVIAGDMLRKIHQKGVGDMLLPVMPLMNGDVGDAPELGADTEAVIKEIAS